MEDYIIILLSNVNIFAMHKVFGKKGIKKGMDIYHWHVVK
jgi:hypothetical protein